MDMLLEAILKNGKEITFGFLFVVYLCVTWKDSKDREKRLMDHLDRTTTTLEQIEKSISGMQEEIKDIREKVEKE
ncbi:hypothetical protein [Priestia aryabhattai]|uniref:hypothetical protein n=1 Tax=Priestia aryabhattai TaxID=412384 RepID=UPI00356B776C